MNTVDMNEEMRKKITRLEYEIAELKAPPQLRIIRGREERYRFVYRLEFEWRGFRNSTMISEEMYHDTKYTAHCQRYGVEATVRALAEKEMEGLITTYVGDS